MSAWPLPPAFFLCLSLFLSLPIRLRLGTERRELADTHGKKRAGEASAGGDKTDVEDDDEDDDYSWGDGYASEAEVGEPLSDADEEEEAAGARAEAWRRTEGERMSSGAGFGSCFFVHLMEQIHRHEQHKRKARLALSPFAQKALALIDMAKSQREDARRRTVRFASSFFAPCAYVCLT